MNDPEIKAMAAVVEYMEIATEREKVRFMHHLTHRYFPNGRFESKRFTLNYEEILGNHSG